MYFIDIMILWLNKIFYIIVIMFFNYKILFLRIHHPEISIHNMDTIFVPRYFHKIKLCVKLNDTDPRHHDQHRSSNFPPSVSTNY